MALYVPPWEVDLRQWCAWTGAPWDKVSATIGRCFRLCAGDENAYSMAATAALRLIVNNQIDPRRVGMLALGTESANDNAVGAVLVRGMLDRALAQLGLPRLPRSCEVPEIKQACLGGVYALKQALRYVATDGADRQAIVLSSDVADYERGSSGEPTQGAGAVAQLVEVSPQLFSVDLRQAGSSSAQRGADFRKPLRCRPAAPAWDAGPTRQPDPPVFNGTYSTVCYVDAVLHAVDALLLKVGRPAPEMYREVEGFFFHRPYGRMATNVMAALYVWGMARSAEHTAELDALCRSANVDPAGVRREARSSPDLYDLLQRGERAEQAYPAAMRAVKTFRNTAKFRAIAARKLSLGSTLMGALGNLYSAALPAWIAAGLEEALAAGRDLVGARFLTVGYGSGDAAEAMLLQVCPGWRAAAGRIGANAALHPAVTLDEHQYAVLHTGRAVEDLRRPDGPHFVLDSVGTRDGAEFRDRGVEYFRYVP